MLARLIICYLIEKTNCYPGRFKYSAKNVQINLGSDYASIPFREFSVFYYNKIRIAIDGRNNTVQFSRLGRQRGTISVYNEDSIEEIHQKFCELIV